MENVFSREDYMAGKCTHHEYYLQFMNQHTIKFVADSIGLQRIINSKHEHFNDIPLAEWDRLNPFIRNCINMQAFKYASNSKPRYVNWSLSDAVCIAKCAAEVIRQQASKDKQ